VKRSPIPATREEVLEYARRPINLDLCVPAELFPIGMRRSAPFAELRHLCGLMSVPRRASHVILMSCGYLTSGVNGTWE
jgi:hypothetical protein